MNRTPKFASVVLDVDSTLSGIEGVDWLAAHRSERIQLTVEALTVKAMAGTLPIEKVYAERLDAIAPSLAEMQTLGVAYHAHLAPRAKDVIDTLRSAGVRVVLVSGGLLPAIRPLAARLRFDIADVHAVDVHNDHRGAYDGFDRESPLARQGGKPEVVKSLALPRPILAVGDGSTDLAIRVADECDAFAAYTGFVSRESVVDHADHTIRSFDELLTLVLPEQS